MKRRNFITTLAALPLAGCAILKPFIRKEPHTILNYGSSSMYHQDRETLRCLTEEGGDTMESPSPCAIALDYASQDSDQHGCIYRRTLCHKYVSEQYVHRALVLVNGDLYVECYDVIQPPICDKFVKLNRVFRDVDENSAQPLFMKHIFKCRILLDNSPNACWLVCGTLPRDEWKVKQWDGCGKLLKTLTEKDFC